MFVISGQSKDIHCRVLKNGNGSKKQSIRKSGTSCFLPLVQGTAISCRPASKYKTSKAAASIGTPIREVEDLSPSLVTLTTSFSLPIIPTLSIQQEAQTLLSQPRNENTSGFVTIRFNHYKKKFPIVNSVLLWEDVDREYSFSFVYKGNFSRELRRICDNDVLGDSTVHLQQHEQLFQLQFQQQTSPLQQQSISPSFQSHSLDSTVAETLTQDLLATNRKNSNFNIRTVLSQALSPITPKESDVHDDISIVDPFPHFDSSRNDFTSATSNNRQQYVRHDLQHVYFIDLVPGKHYYVHIKEDPIAGITDEMRLNQVPISARMLKLLHPPST
jgi:hypothetical protein